MRATIKFIAEQANASITTVSLLLNNKNVRISEEKKRRILELAEQYNYIPNTSAVSLVTKKTRSIGLIVPDVSNIFFSELSKHIEQDIGGRDYSVILCNSHGDAKTEEKYLNILLSRGVDGLICRPSLSKEEGTRAAAKLKSMDVPYVLIDRNFEGGEFPSVTVDHFSGAQLAVGHLLENGHRRIGCLTGPISEYSTQQRLEGYKQAIGSLIDESLIFEGDYRFESGYEQGMKLFDKGITAIFACNDMMAYGIYKAARERGLKIPQDISIVGFDDIYFSAMTDVPLTSVKQPIEAMANRACELLFGIINGNATSSANYIFAPTLSIRDSVRKIS